MATDSQAQEVLLTRDGPVVTLTFNRPEARNALTWNMYERLYQACEEVDADENYVAPGYGVPSEAGREALDLLARTEAILLDPVYSGTTSSLLGKIFMYTSRVPTRWTCGV